MGILALVGSGEFTPAMLEIDRFLLQQIENPRAAIIPTAAGQEEAFSKWIDDGVAHFQKLNASVSGVAIKTVSDANHQSNLKILQESNFFYFSGGDPGYLLDSIKDTTAWEIIFEKYKNGALLAGSSAGAMILGRKVWGRVYEFDKNKKLVPWEDGLNVVPFGIMPHFDVMKKYFSKEDIEKISSNLPQDIEIVGIDEDTVYICIENEWKIMGKGRVVREVKKL